MAETISVVIPVYNGARYLSEAIASVLDQTLPATEVIVVDDGSTDDSADVAARHPIRVVRTAHEGIGPARNRGVEASTGGFLAFLDADDQWAPRKLEVQVGALEAEGADIAFGHIEEFVSPDADPGQLRPPRPPGPGLSPSLAMVRRAAFDRVGPFAGRWVQAEWIDWWARARDAGLRSVVVPEMLARRRLHERNHSRLQAAERAEYASILKESLDRQRGRRA